MPQYNELKQSKKGWIFTAIALVSTLSAGILQAQQQASIIGVDHIGINVPDMNKAVQFFTNVLGFTPVTQIGPIPLDSNWKKLNHIQYGTGPVTIKMVRAGTGANIELFWYADNKGIRKPSGGDDISATHIAFYTDDLPGSVAYLQSKGVQLLGKPFTTPAGDTQGETWVYFLTPWGSKMELVSYPNGKAYEHNHPKALLWSPKDPVANSTITIKSTTMDTTTVQSLVEQHLNIWNEHDEAKRKALMTNAYSDNIEMVDRHFVARGYAEIDGFVKGLQQKNPSARFTHINPIDAHHNIARLFWQFGTKDQPAQVTGMDVFIIADGKIQQLLVFVDGAQ